jgi:hypothetical protein
LYENQRELFTKFFSEKMFQTKVVEKIKTFLCPITLPGIALVFFGGGGDAVEEYCRAVQAR